MALKTIPYLRTIKKEASINTKQLEIVGALIHEARQKQNVSIESLSKDLRINNEKLVAIENGQLDLLPERVLIIGMVKRIAERLKLNSNDLVELLKINPSKVNEEVSIHNDNSIYEYIFGFFKSRKKELKTLINLFYKQSTEKKIKLTKEPKPDKKVSDWEEKIIAVGLKAKEAKVKWEEKKVIESLTQESKLEDNQEIDISNVLEEPIKIKNNEEVEPTTGLKDSIEISKNQEIEKGHDIKESIEENNGNDPSLKTLIVSGGQVIEKIFTQPNGENITIKKEGSD